MGLSMMCRRKTGYRHEFAYALYPHMTVYDNIAFALKMRRAEGSGLTVVRHAAETLQLTELLDRKPNNCLAASGRE